MSLFLDLAYKVKATFLGIVEEIALATSKTALVPNVVDKECNENTIC